MHSPAWELLSHIVQNDAYKETAARKITADMFPTQRTRRVYEFVEEHFKQYRKVPSLDLLSRKFPKGHFTLTVQEPSKYYLDRFVKQHLRAHGSDILMQAAEKLSDDPVKVFEELASESRALLGFGAVTEDVSFGRNWRDRIKAYRRRQKGEMLGIPTPWETWNSMSFGFQPQDFIVISARPGVGKTFFLVWCAVSIARQGKKVLFFEKEMSIEALMRRTDAMEFGLPYNQFRRGNMTPFHMKTWKKGMKRVAKEVKEGDRGDIVYIGDAYMSVSSVEAKIEEYKPDVVIVDGLYLLNDLKGSSDSWQRITNVSREIRALAQQYDVPLLASSQIHRMPGNLEKNWRNLTLGDLAFSDALAQDADIVLALIRTEDMKLKQHMMVKTLKVREDEAKDWGVDWNLGKMQDTFQEIPVEDGSVADQVDRDAEGNVIENTDDVIEEAGGWRDSDLGVNSDAKKKKKKKKRERVD